MVCNRCCVSKYFVSQTAGSPLGGHRSKYARTSPEHFAESATSNGFEQIISCREHDMLCRPAVHRLGTCGACRTGWTRTLALVAPNSNICNIVMILLALECLGTAHPGRWKHGWRTFSYGIGHVSEKCVSHFRLLRHEIYKKIGNETNYVSIQLPGHDISNDPNIYIYSGPLLRYLTSAILLFMVSSLLLTPVIICNAMTSVSLKILVIVISMVLYLFVLTALTRSKTPELILAGATYVLLNTSTIVTSRVL